jgi:exodeoxyribonuclease VII large subunit
LEKHIKLSELTARIQRHIEDSFGGNAFWVVADVTNHTFKGSNNYHYFELVEKEALSSRIVAKISGRAWGAGAVRIANFEQSTGQRFSNNVHVLVLVMVQYTPAFGLQLNLLDIDTSFTLGQFEKMRLATLELLLSRNREFIQRIGDQYLTRNKSLVLRPVIQHLAVLSSDTSAGYQDFRHTLEHNPWNYKFRIDDYFTEVQGEANAKNLVSKLIDIYESGMPYDAVILIRGGGAQTDFLIFDNYDLSRAIAKFPIPIITGIGHQKNETICDLMANTALKTPTKVAEFILANNRLFEERLIQAQKRVIIKAQQTFQLQQRKLVATKSYFVSDVLSLLQHLQNGLSRVSGAMFAVPGMLLQNKERSLGQLQRELAAHTGDLVQNQRSKLMLYETMIRLMDPVQILKKGFAMIKINGRIASDKDELQVGSEITITRASEEVKAVVSAIKKQ